MLKEKIVFKDELPINILVAEIDEYPIHFHDELEVVYVLSGKVILRNGYYNYKLNQGDIFILNDREIHSFSRIQGEDNIVMMMQLDLGYFSAYYEDLQNNFFVTDMDDDDDESLDVLRNTLAKIMMEVLQKGYGYEQKVIESTHNLIGSLQADFQYFLMEDGKFVNETKKKGNKILTGRLSRITKYMYDNYNRKLTLEEIAQREHLSIFYLSHVIKEATGLSFQDLLSFIRVEESEKLLLGSKKKIGAVAEEVGFSAVRYYIKHFEKWFGMHPIEYRKQFTGKVKSRESSAKYRRTSPKEIENAIRKQVKGIYRSYMTPESITPTIIELDLNEREPYMGGGKTKLNLLMKKKIFEPISEPYKLIKSLNENTIIESDHYILTSCEKATEDVKSLSILLYQYDEGFLDLFGGNDDIPLFYRRLRDYNESVEFLLRLYGLSGEFRVLRYLMTKENALNSYRKLNRKDKSGAAREHMRDRWLSHPEVTSETLYAAESVSIRSTLKGCSAELILLDKKIEKAEK